MRHFLAPCAVSTAWSQNTTSLYSKVIARHPLAVCQVAYIWINALRPFHPQCLGRRTRSGTPFCSKTRLINAEDQLSLTGSGKPTVRHQET
ncbi:hypothetical protein GN956_G12055 [Arapaima gigas]